MTDYYPGLNEPVKPLKIPMTEHQYYDEHAPAFRRDDPTEAGQLWLDTKINFLNEVMKFLPRATTNTLIQQTYGEKGIDKQSNSNDIAESVYNKTVFEDKDIGLWKGNQSQIMDQLFTDTNSKIQMGDSSTIIDISRFAGLLGIPFDGELSLGKYNVIDEKENVREVVFMEDVDEDGERLGTYYIEYEDRKGGKKKFDITDKNNNYLVPILKDLKGDDYAKNFREGVNFHATIVDMQHTNASYDNTSKQFTVDANGDGIADGGQDTDNDGVADTDLDTLSNTALDTSLYQNEYLQELGVYKPVLDYSDVFSDFMSGGLFKKDAIDAKYYDFNRKTYNRLQDSIGDTAVTADSDFKSYINKISTTINGLAGDTSAEYIPNIYELARKGVDFTQPAADGTNWSDSDIFNTSMLMLESRRRYTYAMSSIFGVNNAEPDIKDVVSKYSDPDIWQCSADEDYLYMDVSTGNGRYERMYNYFIPIDVGQNHSDPVDKKIEKLNWLNKRSLEYATNKAMFDLYQGSINSAIVAWKDELVGVEGEEGLVIATDDDTPDNIIDFNNMLTKVKTIADADGVLTETQISQFLSLAKEAKDWLVESVPDSEKTAVMTGQEQDTNYNYINGSEYTKSNNKKIYYVNDGATSAEGQKWIQINEFVAKLNKTAGSMLVIKDEALEDRGFIANYLQSWSSVSDISFYKKNSTSLLMEKDIDSDLDSIKNTVMNNSIETMRSYYGLYDSVVDNNGYAAAVGEMEKVIDQSFVVANNTGDVFSILSDTVNKQARMFNDINMIDNFNYIQYGAVRNVSLGEDEADQSLYAKGIMDFGYFPEEIAKTTANSPYLNDKELPDGEEYLQGADDARYEVNMVDKMYFSMIAEMQKMNSFYMMMMFASPKEGTTDEYNFLDPLKASMDTLTEDRKSYVDSASLFKKPSVGDNVNKLMLKVGLVNENALVSTTDVLAENTYEAIAGELFTSGLISTGGEDGEPGYNLLAVPAIPSDLGLSPEYKVLQDKLFVYLKSKEVDDFFTQDALKGKISTYADQVLVTELKGGAAIPDNAFDAISVETSADLVTSGVLVKKTISTTNMLYEFRVADEYRGLDQGDWDALDLGLADTYTVADITSIKNILDFSMYRGATIIDESGNINIADISTSPITAAEYEARGVSSLFRSAAGIEAGVLNDSLVGILNGSDFTFSNIDAEQTIATAKRNFASELIEKSVNEDYSHIKTFVSTLYGRMSSIDFADTAKVGDPANNSTVTTSEFAALDFVQTKDIPKWMENFAPNVSDINTIVGNTPGKSDIYKTILINEGIIAETASGSGNYQILQGIDPNIGLTAFDILIREGFTDDSAQYTFAKDDIYGVDGVATKLNEALLGDSANTLGDWAKSVNNIEYTAFTDKTLKVNTKDTLLSMFTSKEFVQTVCELVKYQEASGFGLVNAEEALTISELNGIWARVNENLSSKLVSTNFDRVSSSSDLNDLWTALTTSGYVIASTRTVVDDDVKPPTSSEVSCTRFNGDALPASSLGDLSFYASTVKALFANNAIVTKDSFNHNSIQQALAVNMGDELYVANTDLSEATGVLAGRGIDLSNYTTYDMISTGEDIIAYEDFDTDFIGVLDKKWGTDDLLVNDMEKTKSNLINAVENSTGEFKRAATADFNSFSDTMTGKLSSTESFNYGNASFDPLMTGAFLNQFQSTYTTNYQYWTKGDESTTTNPNDEDWTLHSGSESVTLGLDAACSRSGTIVSMEDHYPTPYGATTTSLQVSGTPPLNDNFIPVWIGFDGTNNIAQSTIASGDLAGEFSFLSGKTIAEEFDRDFITLATDYAGVTDFDGDGILDESQNFLEAMRSLHARLKADQQYINIQTDRFNNYATQVKEMLLIGSDNTTNSLEELFRDEFYMRDDFDPLIMGAEFQSRYVEGALISSDGDIASEADVLSMTDNVGWYETAGRVVKNSTDTVIDNRMNFSEFDYAMDTDVNVQYETVKAKMKNMKYSGSQGKDNIRSTMERAVRDDFQRTLVLGDLVLNTSANNTKTFSGTTNNNIEATAYSADGEGVKLFNSALMFLTVAKVDGESLVSFATGDVVVKDNPFFVNASAMASLTYEEFKNLPYGEDSDGKILGDILQEGFTPSESTPGMNIPPLSELETKQLYDFLHNIGWNNTAVGSTNSAAHSLIELNSIYMEVVLARIMISMANEDFDNDFNRRKEYYDEEVQKRKESEISQQMAQAKRSQWKAYVKSLGR